MLLQRLIGTGLLVLLLPLVVRAEDSVNLENLEKSYWSAKDDDFSVVQNRAFAKKGRYSLSLETGIPINDPYSEGMAYKVEADYFMNEHWGVGVQYNQFSLKDNSSVRSFIDDHQTVPDHNVLSKFTAASVYFTPLYAKMSLLDKKIIYFDMGIGLVAGNLTYTIQRNDSPTTKSTIAYGFDIFQQFYLSQNWAFRWDFQTLFSNQEKQRFKINSTETEAARSLGSKAIQNTTLTIGITYWK